MQLQFLLVLKLVQSEDPFLGPCGTTAVATVNGSSAEEPIQHELLTSISAYQSHLLLEVIHKVRFKI